MRKKVEIRKALISGEVKVIIGTHCPCWKNLLNFPILNLLSLMNNTALAFHNDPFYGRKETHRTSLL